MTECKFKVGDRVKYTGKDSGYHEKALINKLGTVKKVHPDINFCVVVDWDDKNSSTGAKLPTNLELVTPTSKFVVGKEYKNTVGSIYRCVAIGEFPVLFKKTNSGSGILLIVQEAYREVKIPDNWTEIVPEKWKVLLSINGHNNGYDVEITQETFDSADEANSKWAGNPLYIRTIQTTK